MAAAPMSALCAGLLLIATPAPFASTPAPAASSASPLDSYYHQQPHWRSCGAPYECATVHAPLDYSAPRSEEIALAVVRLPATDKKKRQGPLVFNFGGPGPSGVTELRRNADSLAALGKVHDLVAFDQRGTGSSAPVTCGVDASPAPGSVARQKAAPQPSPTSGQAAVAAECQQYSGELLPYVGTVNAARDLDIIRAALGVSKLDYYGMSYGTRLGGVYAHLFPDSVDRMVLDAVTDPALGYRAQLLGAAEGFQRAYAQFAAACAARGPRCPLGADRETVLARTATLIDDLNRRPLETAMLGEVDGVTMASTIAQFLYTDEVWPELESAVAGAMRGDGAAVDAALDAGMRATHVDPNADPTPAIEAQMAMTAINCADFPDHYRAADAEAAVPQFVRESPIFGGYIASQLALCDSWPVGGDGGYQDVAAPGSPPVLVVGNTGDPATLYAWAPEMARELGTGVLVTLEGSGHGAYMENPSPCVHRMIEQYVDAGTVPENGVRCR